MPILILSEEQMGKLENDKNFVKDWKSMCNINIEEDKFNYNIFLDLTLFITWKGYLLIRKRIVISKYQVLTWKIVKEEDEETGMMIENKFPDKVKIFTKKQIEKKKKDAKKSLLEWYKKRVTNYGLLTKSQKHRLKKVKYLHETEPGCISMKDYALMKEIRVREKLLNDSKKYRLVYKTVICELL